MKFFEILNEQKHFGFGYRIFSSGQAAEEGTLKEGKRKKTNYTSLSILLLPECDSRRNANCLVGRFFAVD